MIHQGSECYDCEQGQEDISPETDWEEITKERFKKISSFIKTYNIKQKRKNRNRQEGKLDGCYFLVEKLDSDFLIKTIADFEAMAIKENLEHQKKKETRAKAAATRAKNKRLKTEAAERAQLKKLIEKYGEK